LVRFISLNDELLFAELPFPETRIIGGKEVGVATPDTFFGYHPGARPYVYRTEGELFLIVTDREDWAAEVLEALPYLRT
jgi:hypothetical protein